MTGGFFYQCRPGCRMKRSKITSSCRICLTNLIFTFCNERCHKQTAPPALTLAFDVVFMSEYSDIRFWVIHGYERGFYNRNLAKCLWWLPYGCLQMKYYPASAWWYRLELSKYFPRPFSGCWGFWSQQSWHLKSSESSSQEWICLAFVESTNQIDEKKKKCRFPQKTLKLWNWSTIS